MQYGTLLNFLDNYCPLILTSYNILFKTNKFHAYFSSIIRIWIMMYSFRRHHYNKVLLIWLSFAKYWENNEKTQDTYYAFANHLNIIDESTVEHVHSVIRRHTTDAATEEQLKIPSRKFLEQAHDNIILEKYLLHLKTMYLVEFS